MTRRRSLARLWRRFRRPSLPRLAVASLAVHVIVLTLGAWLVGTEWRPPALPPPLVVELPPAEPGRPLARPEAPAPAAPARVARPEPRTPPRAVPAPPAPPPPPAPAIPPPAPAPVTPPPSPTVARAPEPPPMPPALPAPAPPPPLPAPAAPPLQPAPAPAARPPAPGAMARAVPEGPPPAPPGTTPSPGASTESPLIGRGFSLLRPKLDVPPLPRLPGGGGTRPEGEGAGEAGREREGQAAIPLNQPPDADHAAYFLKIKKAIEENWSYPRAAAEKGQSGQLVLEFVIKKDGNVLVELVRSSGTDILDRYAVNAVKLSAPFPPIPDRLADSLRISASFTYILDHGFRVFGLR